MSEQNKNAANLPDAYNKDEIEGQTYTDTLSFDDSVIEKIAGITAREIPGILDMKGNFMSGIAENFTSGPNVTKGISADVNERDVTVDVKLILEFGASAPDIFAEMKERVRAQLFQMTGLKLRELNVRVVDVMTQKEYEKQNRDSRQENNYRQAGLPQGY
ncbi:Asp23/Gls24 family envelope stress response protein [Peptococcus simiae]|uniref:Asp23/Gls24 family envelope stress response protein n=1 Tax=Peptococcus simiae TaxID=1643805 RepID=UPI00397EB037